MNPFANRQQPKGWVMSLSILMMVLGILVSVTWLTESSKRQKLNMLPAEVRQRFAVGELSLTDEYKDLTEKYDVILAEVTKLREENGRLQGLAAEGSTAGKELNESLKELRLFAGLSEIQGPGITVTLSDSKLPGEEYGDYAGGIIHDMDVLKAVNELWNAGAEAISVNGKRVTVGTNFRCVGTTILVDAQKIASPVVIQAVGETKTLFSAMNMPGGVLEELRDTDPSMVKVEPAKSLFLPAWSGPTSKKFGKQPEEKK